MEPGLPRTVAGRALIGMFDSSVQAEGGPKAEESAAEPAGDWPRYFHVLVAIDETRASAFALRHVVPYVLDQRSNLTLLAVVPHPPRIAAVGGVSPVQMAREMERGAADRLRRVAAGLPRGLPVTTILRHGDPAVEILELAHERSVDLICMGARGLGRVGGALLGSVSTAVLHRSHVPVVVFHPPANARSI